MKKIFLFLLFSALLITSCSKNNSSSPIVGKWTGNDQKRVLELRADGTFVYSYLGSGSFLREGRGTYGYNPIQQTLSTSYSNGMSYLYIVQTLTSTQLVLLDSDDLYAWSFSKTQ